ncbi:hypothetical protein O3P69_004551 [Scylla paramamosain]|uniref:Uncharacterized protein n=1 Tax=Scylla paramamosain TaxID=85552 RepID=A0AAW0UE07_SCYPA
MEGEEWLSAPGPPPPSFGEHDLAAAAGRGRTDVAGGWQYWGDDLLSSSPEGKSSTPSEGDTAPCTLSRPVACLMMWRSEPRHLSPIVKNLTYG